MSSLVACAGDRVTFFAPWETREFKSGFHDAPMSQVCPDPRWQGRLRRYWWAISFSRCSDVYMPENHDVLSPGSGHGDRDGEVLRRVVVPKWQALPAQQLACGCSLRKTMERHSGFARRRENRDLQTLSRLADISDALFASGSDLVCVAEESDARGTDWRGDHERVLTALQFRVVGLACRQRHTPFVSHVINVGRRPNAQCRRCDGPAKVCVHHLLFPRYEGETVQRSVIAMVRAGPGAERAAGTMRLPQVRVIRENHRTVGLDENTIRSGREPDIFRHFLT